VVQLKGAVLCLVLWSAAAATEPRPTEIKPDAYQRKLSEILSRREFRAGLRQPGIDANLALPELRTPGFLVWLRNAVGRMLDRFFDWLERILRRNTPRSGEGRPWLGSISTTTASAIAVATALLVAWLLWRVRWRRDRAAEDGPITVLPGGDAMPDALSQPSDRWARFAEEFARDGRWRLALRALYLEILVLLHERGALRYERQRTNGEYAAELAGSPAGEAFRQLTFAFDLAWYGNKPFGAAGYRAALGWTRAVDRATAQARGTDGRERGQP
jgi:hypothetical protein